MKKITRIGWVSKGNKPSFYVTGNCLEVLGLMAKRMNRKDYINPFKDFPPLKVRITVEEVEGR